jgi:thiosulfate dehydrogenase [quinone] large subunit
MADTIQIEEPRLARWLFGSTSTAWLWLVLRLWLGWEWFHSGWSKVFGGEIDPFAQGGFHLTGDANIGWIRAAGDRGVGDNIAGFASSAIDSASGPHPSVAYGWYVDFLGFVRDTFHPVLGVAVPLGELLIGLALILGMFTGIAAFLGAILNFSYMFAGSAGTNPAMVVIGFALILAWRNAGWIGLDRSLLPRLGVPWNTGERERVPA